MYCKYTNFHQSYGVLQLSSHPTAPPPPQVHLNVIRMLRQPGPSPWLQAAGGKKAAVNTALRRAVAKLGDMKAVTAQWLGGKMGGIYGGGGWMIFLAINIEPQYRENRWTYMKIW